MKLTHPILTVVLVAFACKTTTEHVEPTVDEKMARLMMLEDQRSLGDGEILTRLSDPAAMVRRRAALALGRIGAPEAAIPLAGLLSDPVEAVRFSAAFALGLLEAPLPPECLQALELALGDPVPEVRGRAAEALGRRGTDETAETIARSLLDQLPTGSPPYAWGEETEKSSLKVPHPDLRLDLFALARLGNFRWAWAVLATEESQPRFLWWPAAWTVSAFDQDEWAVLLDDYLRSDDPYIRTLAVQGYAKISPEQSRQAVLASLEDPDPRVRIEAARASARLVLPEAVPRLLELARVDALSVQAEAIHALASLPDPKALDPIIDRLSDPSPWIRAAALRALAFQDRPSFWLLLSGLDADPDWTVRAELARLLGDLGDRRSVALLVQLASDRDDRVRPHAFAALAKADVDSAVPILIEHLGAEDPEERAAAATELGRPKPEAALEPLAAAMEVARSDPDPAARLAILSALAAYGGEWVEPVARTALDDPSWNVRKQAERILRALGDSTAVARPHDPRYSFDEYLNLLRPPYTPQAFIRTEKGVIEVELFVLDAPMTVANFIRLAREGFYNGLSFHRIVPNFAVQAGDPRGDSRGGPGYTIRCEVNTRPFIRGTLGMALDGKDTGASQFFITHFPQPQLDGVHTVFGQVTAGMEIVDQLAPGDVIRDILIWDGVSPLNVSDSPPSSR